jgi:hypothetical protein
LHHVLREWFALDVVGHVTGIIVFPVAGETQSRGDDELRWTTGPRALDRSANHFKALCEVGAVD